jgi:hypothetical protein
MTISKINLVKMIKSVAVVMMITGIFAACKKDKTETVSEPSIAGKWAGMRGDGNQTPDYDFRFTIKSNGTIDATNAAGGVKGSGNWTLNGTQFTAQYQFVAPLFTKYMVKATYDQATGKLTNGVWGFDDGLYDEGTWYMSKLP